MILTDRQRDALHRLALAAHLAVKVYDHHEPDPYEAAAMAAAGPDETDGMLSTLLADPMDELGLALAELRATFGPLVVP